MTRAWRIAFLAAALGGGAASAAELEIKAEAGYLGEWAFTAELAAAGPGRLAGSYRMVHTGICSVGSPETKEGAITAMPIDKGRAFRAELALEGQTCRFVWRPASRDPAFLECPAGASIPVRPAT